MKEKSAKSDDNEMEKETKVKVRRDITRMNWIILITAMLSLSVSEITLIE